MNIKLQRSLRNATLNLKYLHPRELPPIHIVCVTKRANLIPQVIEKINAQTMKIDKVFFVTQDFTEEQQEQLRTGITNGEVILEEIPSSDSIKLSTRHNNATAKIESGIILIMDDDDIYMPNYVKGQVNMMLRTGADIVVKGDPVVTLADHTRTGWMYPYNTSNAKVLIGAGGSLCFTKEVYNKIPFVEVGSGYDAIFQNTAYLSKIRMVSSDPFNFAIVRGLDDHTWADKGDKAGFGLRINDVNLADVQL